MIGLGGVTVIYNTIKQKCVDSQLAKEPAGIAAAVWSKRMQYKIKRTDHKICPAFRARGDTHGSYDGTSSSTSSSGKTMHGTSSSKVPLRMFVFRPPNLLPATSLLLLPA